MSDLYRIEISQLRLKEPFFVEKETMTLSMRTLMVTTTIFVYPDKVNYCISDGLGQVETVDDAPFSVEDRRRIDWLISMARSMM